MYEVSDQYRDTIRRRSRKYEWRGTITTKTGRVYSFASKDIVKGSGTLTRSCSGSTAFELGSVYAAELVISLFLDADRYSLYDAVIDLYFVCKHRTQRRWNDLSGFSWNALRTFRWDYQYSSEEIPMGRFVISEATRTLTVLQLKAYDYMLKFDKDLVSSGSARTPYEWLKFACDACKVSLGVTEEQVAAMPNGTRSLVWTNLEEDKTYRDLIAQVATVLCGVCQINRSGALVVIPFSRTPIMDIPSSWRYSSKIADYITRYTGLYATYRGGGLTEYFHVAPDDGLIYNIGTNPLLQIASTSERSQIIQSIINHLSTTTYTPFEAEIPGDPALDPMDVLSLSGGQARGEIACITEIVYRINGKSHVKCVGENPRLNQAKSRYTKNIEGLLSQQEGIEGTSTFWMSDAYSPSDMLIEEEETVVTATQFEIQTDKSRGEIIWTGAYALDEPGVVIVTVYLDERVIYVCRDYRPIGSATLTVSTPFEIRRGDEGVHEVRIALAFDGSEESDTSTLVHRLAALENRVRQIESGYNNELEVEETISCSLTPAFGQIVSEAAIAHGGAGYTEIRENVHLELTTIFGEITEEGSTE